jgi:hypothetical protein
LDPDSGLHYTSCIDTIAYILILVRIQPESTSPILPKSRTNESDYATSPAEERRSDLVVIHDTGAHGFAMGYNYNGKLRSAEVLLTEDGGTRLIRRAETERDYFATFDFTGLFGDVE